MKKSPTPFLVSALLAVSLSAQTSWVVTPGNPTNLQTAIDQASAGDEILVQAGTYNMFSLNKGLTVRAVQPGTVFLVDVSFFNLISIPAGEHAHLVGLDGPDMFIIGQGTTTVEDSRWSSQGIVITVGFGPAHFERCVIEAQPFFVGAQACVTVSGTLTAVDTVIRGASGGVTGTTSPALDLQSGTLIGTALTLEGGTGSFSSSAIVADSASVIRLSDSIVTGGGATCSISGGDAECVRCTVSAPCNVQPGTMLGMWASGGVTRGQPYVLDFRGEPNEFVLVFGSNEVDLFHSVDLQLPFLLSAPGCFAATALMTDGSGHASVTWQLPNATLPPAVGLWFQGVSGSSFPLATSTVVGGMVR